MEASQKDVVVTYISDDNAHKTTYAVVLGVLCGVAVALLIAIVLVARSNNTMYAQTDYESDDDADEDARTNKAAHDEQETVECEDDMSSISSHGDDNNNDAGGGENANDNNNNNNNGHGWAKQTRAAGNNTA